MSSRRRLSVDVSRRAAFLFAAVQLARQTRLRARASFGSAKPGGAAIEIEATGFLARAFKQLRSIISTECSVRGGGEPNEGWPRGEFVEQAEAAAKKETQRGAKHRAESRRRDDIVKRQRACDRPRIVRRRAGRLRGT